MATYYKRNAGTDLSLATSWDSVSATGAGPAGPPTISDDLVWQSASIIATMTGTTSARSITVNPGGAAASMIYNTNTLTLGSGGFTFTATNNRIWTGSGVIAVGSTDQNWSIYHTTANQSSINITGGITGTATISVARTTASGNQYVTINSTSGSFAGILALGTGVFYNQTSTAGNTSNSGLGPSATIRIDGTGAGITNSGATNATTIAGSVIANNSFEIGNATHNTVLNLTGNITLNSGGNYTLTTRNPTLSGTIDLSSANHTISSSAATTISGTLTLGSGSVVNTLSSAGGALTLSGTVNCNSGNHIFSTTGAGTHTISGTFNVGTGNLTFLTGAGAMNISSSLNLGSGNHTFTAGGDGNITISSPTFNTGTGSHTFSCTSNGSITISSAFAVGPNYTFSPFFVIQPFNLNGQIRLAGIVSGSNTITNSGTGGLRFTSTGNTFSGPLVLNGGRTYIGTGGYNLGAPTQNFTLVLPSCPSITMNGSNTWLEINTDTSFTFPGTTTISGNGNIIVNAASSEVTFPSGSLDNFDTSSSVSGLGVSAANGTNSGTYSAGSINLYELPSKLSYFLIGGLGAVGCNIKYISTAATKQTYNTNIYMETTGLEHTPRFYANGTSPVVINGGVSKLSMSGVVTPDLSVVTKFVLRGTNTGDNEITGVISGANKLEKDDAGKWILSGNNTFTENLTLLNGTLYLAGSNAYTGTTTLTSGTLRVSATGALGGTSGTISTTANSILEISGGITLNKSSSALTLVGRASNAYSISNLDGDNTFTTSSIALTTTDPTINTESGSILTMSGTASGASRAFVKVGSGTLNLTAIASTFSGIPVIRDGTIGVSTLANGSSNSSLGTASSITLGLAGTTNNINLKHIGTTGVDNCNRALNFNSNAGSTLTLESSGSSAGGVNLSGIITISQTGAHTLALTGTNTVSNTISSTIPDSAATGATSITKSGSNTWVVSGTINATGLVSCSAGTLNFGSTNRSLSGGLTISGGTVAITTGNTISADTTMSGGTITAVLSGASKTLTVTSGSSEVSAVTIQPDDSTNGSNTFTGNAAINGCVDLVIPDAIDPSASATKGTVLGQSNTVTVSGTGIIRTTSANKSTVHRGRARYNNLTFQSGSILKLGYA